MRDIHFFFFCIQPYRKDHCVINCKLDLYTDLFFLLLIFFFLLSQQISYLNPVKRAPLFSFSSSLMNLKSQKSERCVYIRGCSKCRHYTYRRHTVAPTSLLPLYSIYVRLNTDFFFCNALRW